VPAIPIDEGRVSHIFRDADGHFREDTPANRQAIIEVASNPANFVGTDRFGNAWFAEARADGSQIWAQVRDGLIVSGGVNRSVSDFRMP
jgi:hypothetical protein